MTLLAFAGGALHGCQCGIDSCACFKDLIQLRTCRLSDLALNLNQMKSRILILFIKYALFLILSRRQTLIRPNRLTQSWTYWS